MSSLAQNSNFEGQRNAPSVSPVTEQCETIAIVIRTLQIGNKVTSGWTWLIVFWSGCRAGWSSECPGKTRGTHQWRQSLGRRWGRRSSPGARRSRPWRSLISRKIWTYCIYFASFKKPPYPLPLPPSQYKQSRSVPTAAASWTKSESCGNEINQCDRAGRGSTEPNQVEGGGQN